MLRHGSHNAKITLNTAIIIVVDIAYDHVDQLKLAGKTFPVVTFAFQDTPEAFHGAVVDTLAHTGHTLSHTSLFEFVMECSIGVLESAVAVKQRMRIWIGLHGHVKGFEHKRVIVSLTNYIRDNAPVVQI